MRYELFYQSGGHGGPYESLEAAKTRAIELLRGSATERTISIKPYDKDGIGGFGPTVDAVSKYHSGGIE